MSSKIFLSLTVNLDINDRHFRAKSSKAKVGLVSKGEEVIIPQFSNIGNCINGVIWVSYGDYNKNDYYGIYGFYEKYGKKLCPIIYEMA